MSRRLPIFVVLFALLLLACGDGRNLSSTPGAAAAGKGFLYVSNTAANTIAAFLIDNTTGVLLPVPGSPFLSTGDAPGRAAVNSAARLLFVINRNSDTLSSYQIN
jgi:6-phosphogluconolactonase (cycloisomerase 2 family)